MHIPEGYLGPQTYGALYAVMVPFWGVAARKVRDSLRARQAPMIALGAVFSFVIMMFNVPAPGGSTGHAVGGALLGIVLGPWAAMLAISAALVVQALLFGDGGVTAIGANCFNMAVVTPFSAYLLYRVFAHGRAVSTARRMAAAGAAGYISLNLAALFTALEFGIQPLIASTPDGVPLYCPYPVSVTVPAMMAEHLLIFGFIEAVVTGLVVGWLLQSDPALLGLPRQGEPAVAVRRRGVTRGLWWGIGALVLLTPLGLMARGTAWGEWAGSELKDKLGFIPSGIVKLEGLWNSLFPDYTIAGMAGTSGRIVGYILSAAIGVLITGFGVYIVFGVLMRRKNGGENEIEKQSAATSGETWPDTPTGRGGGERFSERTLRGVASLARDIIFSQERAALPGLMQSLDPRVKLVTILAMVVAVSLCRSAGILAIFCAAALLLGIPSGIPLSFVIKRVWLFVPLFSGVIALPALFMVPGEPLWRIGGIGAHDVAVTRQGAEAALIFILRVTASVSFIALLSQTTRWTRLVRALRVVFVPPIFIFIIGITYRYIFYLLIFIEEMHVARKSRTLAPEGAGGARGWVAGRMGFTLRRVLRMGDDIYDAMASRGFSGDVRFVDVARPGLWDAAWAAGVAGCLAAVYMTGGFS